MYGLPIPIFQNLPNGTVTILRGAVLNPYGVSDLEIWTFDEAWIPIPFAENRENRSLQNSNPQNHMVLPKFSKERGEAVGQRFSAGLSPAVELRAEHVVQKFSLQGARCQILAGKRVFRLGSANLFEMTM